MTPLLKQTCLVVTLSMFFNLSFSTVYAKQAPQHFKKIMVVVLENKSSSEIKNQPAFKKMLDFAQKQKQDTFANGYAVFSNYYNNHNGGSTPTRPSQPNYLAMTSGSTHKVADNEIHDLAVDHLANELIKAGISWKVYAEDLPYMANQQCFLAASFPSYDGYQRKHEPFISYSSIQNNPTYCKNIVNANELQQDLSDFAQVSFYIPNQIHDGHNGPPMVRLNNINNFLSQMLGLNARTGELLKTAHAAPLQQFLSQGGLLVLTFDEPGNNQDLRLYTVLIGKMINSKVYAPSCYPAANKQTLASDANGKYSAAHCNHYNLLKLIETNWQLQGLDKNFASAGYQYAFSLAQNLPYLWKKNPKN
jgi:hypothetical protein